MRKIALLAVLLGLAVVFFGLAPALAALPPYSKVLVYNNTFQGAYCVNDRGDVAYVTSDAGGVHQIYLWRRGVAIQITHNISEGTISQGWINSLQINNQGQLAWSQMDWDDGNHGNRNVYFYDGAVVRRLNDNLGQYSGASLHPNLNNQGQVVWAQAFWAQPYHIYFYSGGPVTKLTSGDDSNDWPQLNDLGWILWQRSGQVLVYDGASTRTITGPGVYVWAQINNRGQALYWRQRVFAYENNDIFLHNLSTDQVTKVTNNGATNDYDGGPCVLNNDGQVIWTNRQYVPVDRNDLYLYSQGAVTQITNAGNTPNGVESELITLKNGGWLAYKSPGGGGLWVYRGGERLQVNSDTHAFPQLNNRGWVAWQTPYGGSGRYEIYLGSPPVALSGLDLLLLN